jgi:large subunit ribosomal protein L19
MVVDREGRWTMNPIITELDKKQLRQEPLGDFDVGDSINVHLRIKEGDKERIQIFNGTVIRFNRGHGAINQSFTVRRIVDGVGIERVFPVHSPTVVKTEITRRGRVRRAKLYYLRDRIGKATKTKERIISKHDRSATGKAR